MPVSNLVCMWTVIEGCVEAIDAFTVLSKLLTQIDKQLSGEAGITHAVCNWQVPP